jgi:hypothetical protein
VGRLLQNCYKVAVPQTGNRQAHVLTALTAHLSNSNRLGVVASFNSSVARRLTFSSVSTQAMRRLRRDALGLLRAVQTRLEPHRAGRRTMTLIVSPRLKISAVVSTV